MNPARVERSALCDTALGVGPDAPTLCDGWDVRELLAHLVVRERRPDAALGIVASPLAGYGDRVRHAAGRRPFPALVDEVRAGPPRWSPLRCGAIDRVANTVEMFVHHEDIRRAQPDWQPRLVPTDVDDELAARLRRMARLLLRRAPTGVQLALTGREPFVARRGDELVTVSGTPAEVTLFVSGRQAHADVDLIGPPAAATLLRTAKLGL